MKNTKESQEILIEYDYLQTKADRIRDDRKQEVYEKIPRIREIDETLSMTSIKILKAIQSKVTDGAKLIEELRENNDVLISEKKYLLNQGGFSEDYLEDVFECKLCKDTGFIGNTRCKCFEQKIIKKLHADSQIENRTVKENFDTFILDYYSGEKINGISPKEKMTLIHKECLEFTKDFPNTYKNFLFYGNPGLGKTFMCNCVAFEIINKGYKVVYVMANNLFGKLADLRFDKGDKIENSEFYNSVYNADLLIIDDLGSEFITEFSKPELFNLINARIIGEKSTIISTNLTMSKINSIYTDRVFSRIIDSYDICEFIGSDIRSAKRGL